MRSKRDNKSSHKGKPTYVERKSFLRVSSEFPDSAELPRCAWGDVLDTKGAQATDDSSCYAPCPRFVPSGVRLLVALKPSAIDSEKDGYRAKRSFGAAMVLSRRESRTETGE